MTSSNRKKFHVTLVLCWEPSITDDSPQKGTVTRTSDISSVGSLNKLWNKHSIAGNSRQHVGFWWPDAYLASGRLKPSCGNRTVAYLSSYKFLQSCPVASATLRKTACSSCSINGNICILGVHSQR